MNCANSGIEHKNRFPLPLLLLVLFMLAAGSPLFSQERFSEQDSEGLEDVEVFTPFVSQIRTAIRGNQVRITWTDIPGLEDARYRIYRHNVEITAETLDNARVLTEVPAGVQNYIDELAVNGAYFYAVVTLDSNGNDLPILIPFRNRTALATVITGIPEDFAAAGIRALTARPTSQAIELRFETVGINEDIILFRSSSPIASPADLDEAISLGRISPSEGGYRDFVLPGIAYFYALLPESMYNRGQILLVPGQNSLEDPVELPLGTRYPGIGRLSSSIQQTLPILVIDRSILDGSSLGAPGLEIPETRPLSEEALQAVRRLSAPIRLESPPAPVAVTLPSEGPETPAAGLDGVLKDIIQSSFVLENYQLASRQLEDFLTLPLDGDLEYRSRFYYAQSLYFSGRLYASYLQFLLIQEKDAGTIRSWMDYILRDLSDRSAS